MKKKVLRTTYMALFCHGGFYKADDDNLFIPTLILVHRVYFNLKCRI